MIEFQMTRDALADLAFNPGCEDERWPRWVVEACHADEFSVTGPRDALGFQIAPFDVERRDEDPPYKAGDWLARDHHGRITAQHDT